MNLRGYRHWRAERPIRRLVSREMITRPGMQNGGTVRGYQTSFTLPAAMVTFEHGPTVCLCIGALGGDVRYCRVRDAAQIVGPYN
jgi:hypothetical protein